MLGHKFGTDHIPANVIRQYILDWDDYFSFTFVRNPYDRMVSFYKYWLSRKSNALKFEDFLENFLHKFKEHRNQYNWVSLRGSVIVTYIGRTENFDNDIRHIGRVIGITIPNNIVSKNVNRTDDYHSYYTKRSIRLIQKYCAKDLDCFGYKF